MTVAHGGLEAELNALVLGGIPDTLLQNRAAVSEAAGVRQGTGGAFEGGDAEPKFLDAVRTAVPSVEVSPDTFLLTFSEYPREIRSSCLLKPCDTHGMEHPGDESRQVT